jgi:hypothetical protein
MPRYSKEEFTRRGNALYNEEVRLLVDIDGNRNKFVAIDIDSGAWEMDADALTACDRLEARRPDSQIWLVRVGYGFVHRLYLTAV